jgi:hypothetical protein
LKFAIDLLKEELMRIKLSVFPNKDEVKELEKAIKILNGVVNKESRKL